MEITWRRKMYQRTGTYQ